MRTDSEAKPSGAEELPEPSAELVLIRAFVVSYLSTCHLKPSARAEAFLRHASELLATEDSVALLFPIRPETRQAEVNRARRQAVTLFRQLTPTFVAALAGRE